MKTWLPVYPIIQRRENIIPRFNFSEPLVIDMIGAEGIVRGGESAASFTNGGTLSSPTYGGLRLEEEIAQWIKAARKKRHA